MRCLSYGCSGDGAGLELAARIADLQFCIEDLFLKLGNGAFAFYQLDEEIGHQLPHF